LGNQSIIGRIKYKRYLIDIYMKKVPFNSSNELTVKDIEGYYIRKVTPFGTSAKVDCPKEHLGKTVFLVITSNESESVRL
jgi:putative transposon-encoded protein